MRLILGLLLLTLLTACTSNGDGAPTNSSDGAPADGSQVVQPTWTTRLKPIGQPTLTGDRAILLVKTGGDELDIVGLDAATGQEVWRHPWSPGAIATGYTLSPTLAKGRSGDEYVVFQRPRRGLTDADSWWAPLVVVDPRTGEVKHQTKSVLVMETLGACLSGEDVCASIRTGDRDDSITMRLDLDRGRLGPAVEGIPDDARTVGPTGLYSRWGADGERLGRVVDGETLWEVPVDDVFPQGFGSNAGWHFGHDEDAGIIYGNLGNLPDPDSVARYDAGEPVEVDLRAREAMVGIDAATGSLAWTMRGRNFGCAAVDGAAPPARCRTAGMAIDQKGQKPVVKTLSLAVEGFDVRSGETTWSVKVTRAQARRMLTGKPSVTTNEGRVVRTPSGRVAIDYDDGTTAPVADDAVFLCETARTRFRYALAFNGDHERSGNTLLRPCTADGKKHSGALTADAVRRGAVEGPDGMYLVATNREIAGHQLQ